MKYQRLSIFLNRKLWYQLSKSIQELLILIKTAKRLKMKSGGDLWFLFGRSIYKFFRKFCSHIIKNTLKLTHFLLIYGIVNYEIFFIEDRIAFIEREFFKVSKKSKSLSGEILMFLILIYSKISLKETKDNHKWLNQINLIKKIKKKNNFLEKIFRISETLSISKISPLQFTTVPFKFAPSTKLLKRKSILIAEERLCEKLKTKEKKKAGYSKISPKFFRFMETMTLNYFFEMEWEKKIWVSDSHLFRTKIKNKTHNCFFQKPFENFIQPFFFEWILKKRIFDTFNFILGRQGNKKNLRWSKFGKFIEFSPPQVEMSLVNFLRNLDFKIFLDQERQLIKKTKENFFDRNSLIKNYDRKNFLFIKKTKKLFELSQVIVKRKKKTRLFLPN